ncbi:hypothetical protein FA13DRAFT_1737558 [Coprinellus micaceus]|uniref:Uncharacterized protein n=1 Tax=Coprinellus micaceus TaxID=71717 RepID=A0A4Y7SYS8_COPMI|nr:hypothetical protein FA13DRAFT_1737558 [Coprinellus micaceus]
MPRGPRLSSPSTLRYWGEDTEDGGTADGLSSSPSIILDSLQQESIKIQASNKQRASTPNKDEICIKPRYIFGVACDL